MNEKLDSNCYKSTWYFFRNCNYFRVFNIDEKTEEVTERLSKYSNELEIRNSEELIF